MSKQKATHIEDAIEDCEYTKAKLDFVKSRFPDATLGRYYPHFISMFPAFTSEKVNSDYTKLKFETQRGNRLIVIPYVELVFEYNGKEETIIINSMPRSSTLCYVESGTKRTKKGLAKYSRFPNISNTSFPTKEATKEIKKKDVIKFCKLSINLKNNNFNDKMMGDCRVQMTRFIQDHSGYELDQKYMDPKIKKLLMFV